MVFLTLFLLCLAVTTISAVRDAQYCDGTPNTLNIESWAPIYVTEVPNGYLFRTSNPSIDPPIYISHLYGSAYEQGQANGQMLRDQIQTMFPAAIDYFSSSWPSDASQAPAPFTNMNFTQALDYVHTLTKPYIPDRFTDEIRGLADGAGISVDLAWQLNLFPELTNMSCSMFGAWNQATMQSNQGGLIQLRALDWDTQGPFNQFPVISVYHMDPLDPSSGHSFANIGWAGFVGAISGFSANGTAISQKYWKNYYGTFSNTGTPTTFVLRDLLQFPSTVEEAMKTLETTARTNSVFIGFGTTNEGDPGEGMGAFWALEYSHDYLMQMSDRTFVGYGNHTNMAGLVYIDKHTQPDAGEGAWCLDNLMKQFYGNISAELTIQQITARYETGDAQVCVYDFKADAAYIAYPSVANAAGQAVPAYARPFTRFPMKEMFLFRKRNIQK